MICYNKGKFVAVSFFKNIQMYLQLKSKTIYSYFFEPFDRQDVIKFHAKYKENECT